MIKLEDIATYENLLTSFKAVYRNTNKTRNAAVLYRMKMQPNLNKLRDRLLEGSFKLSHIHKFRVYEPKEREIIASQFEDKIVLDLISKRALKPLISPVVIFDNYASQDGKGTHKALTRLQRHSIRYAKSVNWSNRGWVYAFDITKFFYMIDQLICKSMVDQLDIDDMIKGLVYQAIEICTPDLNPYTSEPNKGLCIGFHTSQWLSVYYLNGMDHFIKEKLRLKYYGRYADDFYIIHENREYLEECVKQISDYLTNKLKLNLNKKSHLYPFSQGICFLGYHVTYNPNDRQVHTNIRMKSINKMKRRVKKQIVAIQNGTMTLEHAYASLQSWFSYAQHGETDTAVNAYRVAKKKFDDLAAMYAEADVVRSNWDSVDEDGFMLLQPNIEYIEAMSGGHFKLHRKLSEHEASQHLDKLGFTINPTPYIDKNFSALVLPELYLPKPDTKKQRFIDGMHEIGLNLDYDDIFI